MKLRICSNEGELFYTNLSPSDNLVADQCAEENGIFILNSKKFRHGKLTLNEGVVYLMVDDVEIVSRPRYFREILKAHTTLLKNFPSVRNSVSQSSIKSSRQLLHDITDLNAKNIQEVFTLLSEEELRGITKQREYIKNTISGKLDQAAAIILRIIKNNAAIRNEISAFKKIQESKPKVNKQRHHIKKVLQNIMYLLRSEFDESNITIAIEETDVYIMFDYESFQVAVHNLLENASKYAMPGSNIDIRFKNKEGFFIIQFDMISMQILPDELDKIHHDGFSGFFAKKSGKNGQGIGMVKIDKMLPLNSAKLFILPDLDKAKEVSFNGIEYRNNIFEIRFPNKFLV